MFHKCNMKLKRITGPLYIINKSENPMFKQTRMYCSDTT